MPTFGRAQTNEFALRPQHPFPCSGTRLREWLWSWQRIVPAQRAICSLVAWRSLVVQLVLSTHGGSLLNSSWTRFALAPGEVEDDDDHLDGADDWEDVEGVIDDFERGINAVPRCLLQHSSGFDVSILYQNISDVFVKQHDVTRAQI